MEVTFEPRYNLLNKTLTIRFNGYYPNLMLNGEYKMDSNLTIGLWWPPISHLFWGGNGAYHFGTRDNTLNLFAQIVLPLFGNISVNALDFGLVFNEESLRFRFEDLNLGGQYWYWEDIEWYLALYLKTIQWDPEYLKCELNWIIGVSL